MPLSPLLRPCPAPPPLARAGGASPASLLVVLVALAGGCELTGKDSAASDNPCIASSRSDTEGERVIASGGAVEAEFQGGDAGFENIVSLVEPAEVRIGKLHTTTPGAVVSLGSFGEDDELVFQIATPEGNRFFTGPADRNPDGIPHARVVKLDNGEYHIGFEDIAGGGDGDFDDTCVVIRGAVTSLLGG
jgi:hypothetical protein